MVDALEFEPEIHQRKDIVQMYIDEDNTSATPHHNQDFNLREAQREQLKLVKAQTPIWRTLLENLASALAALPNAQSLVLTDSLPTFYYTSGQL